MPDKCIERSHEAGMLQEWAESCNPAALSKLIDGRVREGEYRNAATRRQRGGNLSQARDDRTGLSGTGAGMYEGTADVRGECFLLSRQAVNANHACAAPRIASAR